MEDHAVPATLPAPNPGYLPPPLVERLTEAKSGSACGRGKPGQRRTILLSGHIAGAPTACCPPPSALICSPGLSTPPSQSPRAATLPLSARAAEIDLPRERIQPIRWDQQSRKVRMRSPRAFSANQPFSAPASTPRMKYLPRNRKHSSGTPTVKREAAICRL